MLKKPVFPAKLPCFKADFALFLPDLTTEHVFFFHEKKYVVTTLDNLTFRSIECIIVKENYKTFCDNRGDNNTLSDPLSVFLRKNLKSKGIGDSPKNRR